jgi:hypothetical protein
MWTARRAGSLVAIGFILIVVLSGSFWAATFLLKDDQPGSSGRTNAEQSYTINGSTCQDPNGTSPAIAALISSVTQSPRFQQATNESRFLLGNYENITGRVQTIGGKLLAGPAQNGSVIGGTAVHLPDVTELVFYSYGASTTCGRVPGDYVALDVQVPVQDGVYNMTGMQISTLRGPY